MNRLERMREAEHIADAIEDYEVTDENRRVTGAIIWLLRRYAAEQREKDAQEKAPDLSDRG